MGDARKVILYEVNEVPWEILDLRARTAPDSPLVSLMRQSRQETTVNRDPEHLQPWRTWPTFHKGLYCADHGSLELGQDPSTFRGENIWDVAERNGKKIGLFGPLQSWPARQPRHGGFYVPDTFSRDPVTHPKALERFQAFNLRMTKQNAFSSDAPLNVKDVALAGLDVARRGLTPWSVQFAARQIIRERRDARVKGARSILQALPSFDLYWRLHRSTEPDLSIFFTNHVASMMHRYWGDAVPGYSEQYGYERDEIFARFLDDALSILDRHLDRIVRWVDSRDDTLLIVASSMGQAAVPYKHVGATYVLVDAARMLATLGLPPARPGLAMYPRTSLEFATTEQARAAAEALEPITVGGVSLFADCRADGLTLSVALRYVLDGERIGEEADLGDRTVPLRDLGVSTENRLGGGNTAYHIPEGILLTYGPGISPDASRAEIEVIEVAPRLLETLGLAHQRESVESSAPAGG